jgi:hypothetical protein
MPMTTASLANSEGWMESPASRTHDWDPLTVEPMVSTSTRPRTDSR